MLDKLSKVIVSFFVLSLLISNTISAIQISPPLLDLSDTSRFVSGPVLTPGDRYEGKFKIIFREDDPETLFLYIKKLDISDTNGEPIISNKVSQEKDNLDKWIKLDSSTVQKPSRIGQCNECNVAEVNYTIDIPSYAVGGAYLAAIIVSKSPPDIRDGASAVALGEELVYQLFINLKGDVKYDTRVISFATKNGQFFFTSMPINFITNLQNNGDNYIVPKGYIYIYNSGVRIREEGTQFNSLANRLFPGKSRIFFSTFSEEGFDRGLTEQELIQDEMILKRLEAETKSKYPYVYESLGDQDQRFLFFSIPKFTNEEKNSTNFFYWIVYGINSYLENLVYQVQHFRLGLFNAELELFLGNQAPTKVSTNFFVFPAHLIFTIAMGIGFVYLLFKRSSRSSPKSKRVKTKLSKNNAK